MCGPLGETISAEDRRFFKARVLDPRTWRGGAASSEFLGIGGKVFACRQKVTLDELPAERLSGLIAPVKLRCT